MVEFEESFYDYAVKHINQDDNCSCGLYAGFVFPALTGRFKGYFKWHSGEIWQDGEKGNSYLKWQLAHMLAHLIIVHNKYVLPFDKENFGKVNEESIQFNANDLKFLEPHMVDMKHLDKRWSELQWQSILLCDAPLGKETQKHLTYRGGTTTPLKNVSKPVRELGEYIFSKINREIFLDSDFVLEICKVFAFNYGKLYGRNESMVACLRKTPQNVNDGMAKAARQIQLHQTLEDIDGYQLTQPCDLFVVYLSGLHYTLLKFTITPLQMLERDNTHFYSEKKDFIPERTINCTVYDSLNTGEPKPYIEASLKTLKQEMLKTLYIINKHVSENKNKIMFNDLCKAVFGKRAPVLRPKKSKIQKQILQCERVNHYTHEENIIVDGVRRSVRFGMYINQNGEETNPLLYAIKALVALRFKIKDGLLKDSTLDTSDAIYYKACRTNVIKYIKEIVFKNIQVLLDTGTVSVDIQNEVVHVDIKLDNNTESHGYWLRMCGWEENWWNNFAKTQKIIFTKEKDGGNDDLIEGSNSFKGRSVKRKGIRYNDNIYYITSDSGVVNSTDGVVRQSSEDYMCQNFEEAMNALRRGERVNNYDKHFACYHNYISLLALQHVLKQKTDSTQEQSITVSVTDIDEAEVQNMIATCSSSLQASAFTSEDYAFIDVFAGGGGASMGLALAGFKPLFIIEALETKRNAYKANFVVDDSAFFNKDKGFVYGREKRKREEQFESILVSLKQRLNGTRLKHLHVHGSPSCRSASNANNFSSQKKQAGDSFNEENSLNDSLGTMLWYIEFLKFLTSKGKGLAWDFTWTLEEAPTLIKQEAWEKLERGNGNTRFKWFQNAMIPLEGAIRVYDFCQFGLPTNRKRMVCGSKILLENAEQHIGLTDIGDTYTEELAQISSSSLDRPLVSMQKAFSIAGLQIPPLTIGMTGSLVSNFVAHERYKYPRKERANFNVKDALKIVIKHKKEMAEALNKKSDAAAFTYANFLQKNSLYNELTENLSSAEEFESLAETIEGGSREDQAAANRKTGNSLFNLRKVSWMRKWDELGYTITANEGTGPRWAVRADLSEKPVKDMQKNDCFWIWKANTISETFFTKKQLRVLMSFPLNFEFDSTGTQQKQRENAQYAVGDAVPPLFTYRLAKILKDEFEPPNLDVVLKSIYSFELKDLVTKVGATRNSVLNDLINQFYEALDNGTLQKDDDSNYSAGTIRQYCQSINKMYTDKSREDYSTFQQLKTAFSEKLISRIDTNSHNTARSAVLLYDKFLANFASVERIENVIKSQELFVDMKLKNILSLRTDRITEKDVKLPKMFNNLTDMEKNKVKNIIKEYVKDNHVDTRDTLVKEKLRDDLNSDLLVNNALAQAHFLKWKQRLFILFRDLIQERQNQERQNERKDRKTSTPARLQDATPSASRKRRRTTPITAQPKKSEQFVNTFEFLALKNERDSCYASAVMQVLLGVFGYDIFSPNLLLMYAPKGDTALEKFSLLYKNKKSREALETLIVFKNSVMGEGQQDAGLFLLKVLMKLKFKVGMFYEFTYLNNKLRDSDEYFLRRFVREKKVKGRISDYRQLLFNFSENYIKKGEFTEFNKHMLHTKVNDETKTLQECVKNYFKTDITDRGVQKQNIMLFAPDFLIVKAHNINNDNIKGTGIQYTEQLEVPVTDMSYDGTNFLRTETPYTYNLRAVVFHKGSTVSGHYTCNVDGTYIDDLNATLKQRSVLEPPRNFTPEIFVYQRLYNASKKILLKI